MDEAFSLALTSSDRFGLNGVLAGHIEVINKLVEDEDYARVKEGILGYTGNVQLYWSILNSTQNSRNTGMIQGGTVHYMC